MRDIICQAIQTRCLLQFSYEGATRVVEPHMLAYNSANHLALSAWWIRGYSESGASTRWREYLLSEMRLASVLQEQFSGSRPGYNRTGGKSFHNVICAL